MTADFSLSALRNVRRGFADIAEGQVHFRSFGSGEGRPIVMLHYSPGSSFSLVPLGLALGRRRRVIALDTLGNGDSSPSPLAAPGIPDLADAHFRALAALGIHEFDIYGCHTGASLAMEIALAHPGCVGKMVLDGVSLFSVAERDSMLGNDHAPELTIDREGTQLIRVWHMIRDAHIYFPWWDRRAERRRDRGMPSAEFLHGELVEVLKALPSYFLSYRAALTYDKRSRAGKVTAPVLLCCAKSDPLFDMMEEAAKLFPDVLTTAIPGTETSDDVAASAEIMLSFLG